MQTFLPHADFELSARALDKRRLGNQRNEAWVLLRASTGEIKGWSQHPASKMWVGHAHALARYGIAMCQEFTRRGCADTVCARFEEWLQNTTLPDKGDPPWLGSQAFHTAHQSNLVAKDPEYYGALWPNAPRGLPYVWP
ncbi:cytoplasmic protein [bacterium]|nr:cytoplasmic protein [bacterium]